MTIQTRYYIEIKLLARNPEYTLNYFAPK